MTRTVLITEIIAPYRIPVFNALARHEAIDLHVIFLAETDKTLRQWRVYKDEIRFSFEILQSHRWRAGKHTMLVNRGVRDALKAANPNSILCGGYNYPASWQSLRWSSQHDVPFVLWSESNVQDQRGGNLAIEWLKRYFIKNCTAFVVPGKSAADYLKTLGVGDPGIFTAPNAVDNEFFRRRADEARSKTSLRENMQLPGRFLLCVSRFVREKGVFDLLEAYAKLDEALRSEVGLVLAGDGPAGGELVDRAKRISPGTICFPGFLQREELAILYALAEALVLPTHSDPWGLVVNEAMACGLSIIVTSVAGCAADLVTDAWNGYVVPPRDAARLAASMTSLVKNSELRQQMSRRSLDRIRNFSPEACAGGLAAAACSARRIA